MVPTCKVLAFRALGRRAGRDRSLELSTTPNHDFGTPVIAFVCRDGQIGPISSTRCDKPPEPTFGSKSASMPRAPIATWVGIPRDNGCLEGLRDLLNFFENDILIATVEKKIPGAR